MKREKDEKVFTIPLKRLSGGDQKFVAQWLKKKRRNTRPSRKVTLTLEGGKTKEMACSEGEYLSDDGTLTLYPGDTIHLEFPESEEGEAKPKIVDKVENPKRTVTFEMTQKESITMLIRKTKMQKTVAMDCTHRPLENKEFSRTNLRPTEKGLGAYDSWPAAVWTLRLSNFEVTDRSASEVYQERISK